MIMTHQQLDIQSGRNLVESEKLLHKNNITKDIRKFSISFVFFMEKK